jgi:hypothetical protein
MKVLDRHGGCVIMTVCNRKKRITTRGIAM